jgi:hypothetical protein
MLKAKINVPSFGYAVKQKYIWKIYDMTGRLVDIVPKKDVNA